MFLKRVEIAGFKSFASKTVLEFLPFAEKGCGITAVVGPNGSGKSNVADAIRWAMGEQSMKNLRGKKAEDIIFAGSGKKGRMSAASVTLHFDNSDKRIPLDFTEVTITRKIYRDGEGEYLINNNRARLIDVVDLLAKAGIGKDSYCVINQGMSDAVLNATAVERRAILEDAAGVKQYQIKKDRAIRKLQSTRANLDRVSGIVLELEPHLKLLKRQAEKALKGKDVANLLHEKQRQLFAYKWHFFQQEKKEMLEKKEVLGIKTMNLQRETDILVDTVSKESKVAEDFKKQESLERERAEAYRRLNDVEKELIVTEGRIEMVKERQIQELVIQSIPVDSAFVRKQIETIRENQEKLIERIEKAETIEEMQGIKEFARAIQQELHDLHQNIGKGKVVLEQKNPEYAKAKAEKDSLLASLAKKSAEARVGIDVLKKRVEAIALEIEQEIKQNKENRLKIFDIEHQVRTKQDELNKLRDRFNDAKIELARVEVREEDLINEVRDELRSTVEELAYDGNPCDASLLEKDISKLKFQFEQIGGIDPMVVDEYEEVNKRYDFLTKESSDLESAIVSLKEVAKEMDKQIDEVFSKAFESINEEFTKYFKIIFGGGNAHLSKSRIKNRKTKSAEGDEIIIENSETDDSTESSIDNQDDELSEVGVDIIGCPPGKKISNLAMLSGGERALTSLALLFAIISYNPPPFSVLDEVEAALDEANSRRFSRILQELSNDTQFIAITHNRETMRQASLLYGVTMSEDGVSKILSVKLEQVGAKGEIRNG